MKEFIEYLVRNIVTNPDAVEVVEDHNAEGGQYSYNINVDQADMGILIGKEGRTIRSIRSIARAKAIRDDIRINIELVEGDRPHQTEQPVEES